jgi:uncharacterized protein YkwD
MTRVAAFLIIVLAAALDLSAQDSSPVRANFLVPGPLEITDASGGSSASLASLEKHAFRLINEQRAARGLPRLEWNDDLARVARFHSGNMAAYKFFSHRGADGSLVDDRADQFGISNWRAIGENIAFNRGYAHPEELAVRKWMESTAHRENLLNRNWLETGIGIAVSPDGAYYITQIFLLKK